MSFCDTKTERGRGQSCKRAGFFSVIPLGNHKENIYRIYTKRNKNISLKKSAEHKKIGIQEVRNKLFSGHIENNWEQKSSVSVSSNANGLHSSLKIGQNRWHRSSYMLSTRDCLRSENLKVERERMEKHILCKYKTKDSMNGFILISKNRP